MLIEVDEAIQEIKSGKMIILTEGNSREQEGDLVIAAEMITPEIINFMASHARGLICLALNKQIMTNLQIPLMPERNKLPNQAAFGVSIDAAKGITTGVSAFDRAFTIKLAVDATTQFNDISMPGHVFPLQAVDGGILQRAGHTEGSIELMNMAKLKPAAVICEIMNEDGTMSRSADLEKFSNKHKIKIVSIDKLIQYKKHQSISFA